MFTLSSFRSETRHMGEVNKVFLTQLNLCQVSVRLEFNLRLRRAQQTSVGGTLETKLAGIFIWGLPLEEVDCFAERATPAGAA